MILEEKIKKSLAHRRETMSQLALKFVLWEDAVSTVIPGIKNEIALFVDTLKN